MDKRLRDKITPPPNQLTSPWRSQFIWWGVILIQLAVILVALVLVWRSSTSHSDDAAALNAPPAVVFVTRTPPPPLPPISIPTAPSPLPTSPPVSASHLPPALPPPSSLLSPLHLRGLEITQGIQVFDEPEQTRCNPDPAQPDYIFCNNSVPLVAGRNTLARVYLACNGACPTADTLVWLRLLKDGQEMVNVTQQLPAVILSQVNAVSMPDLRLNLGSSVNFQFAPPPDWLTGPVTFEVSAGPEGAPATGLTLTKEFIARKPLRIAYLPIQYQGKLPTTPPNIDYWLLRLYPVPGVQYYRLPMPDLVWDGEVSKSDILRKLLYVYWLYVQNRPQAEWPDQLFGWLPQEFYNGGISDPFWCPQCLGPHSSRVAFGGLRPETDIGGPRILVHEIAHNLGAQHAWSPTQREDGACFKTEGADIQVDPTWPYAQTPRIQEVGLDLYSQPPLVYPASFYDMMAYCFQPWISPYTYRRIFDSPFLQPDATTRLALADFKPSAETEANGALMVSGIVYPDGTVSRPEVVRLADVASAFSAPLEFVPPPGNDYCLNVQAADHTSLAQHCFDVGFMDMETGQNEPSPYFLTLPDSGGDIANVTLSKNQVSLMIVEPSQSPPQVRLISPNGGETWSDQQTIVWEATDADGDPLTYDLFYSLDNGQSWLPLAVRLGQTSYPFYTDQLPPTHDTLIRVVANDGFNTTADESDAPFSIAAPSDNSLGLRGPAVVEPGQTFEVAVLAHQLTEPGLFGVQFKLNFDPTRVQVDNLRLHPDLNLVVDETIDNQTGQVSVIASRRGRVDNLTGDLTLAVLTLTAHQAKGRADFTLSEIGAGARGGVRLAVAEVGGLSINIR